MRSAGASVAHLVEPSPSACCSISASSLGQIRIRAGGEGILSTLDDRAFRCLGPPRRGGRKNPSLTANKFAPKSRRGNSRAPDGAGTINGTRAAHVSPTWSEQSVLYQTRWLPSQRNAGLKSLIGLNCLAATRGVLRKDSERADQVRISSGNQRNCVRRAGTRRRAHDYTGALYPVRRLSIDLRG